MNRTLYKMFAGANARWWTPNAARAQPTTPEEIQRQHDHVANKKKKRRAGQCCIFEPAVAMIDQLRDGQLINRLAEICAGLHDANPAAIARLPTLQGAEGVAICTGMFRLVVVLVLPNQTQKMGPTTRPAQELRCLPY